MKVATLAVLFAPLTQGIKGQRLSGTNTVDYNTSSTNELPGSLGRGLKKKKGKRKDKKKRNDKKRKTERVVVQYATEQARTLLLNEAIKVYHDFSSDNTLVIEADKGIFEFMELRDESSGIVSMEEDPIWYELGFQEEELIPGDRRLVEDVPWGIAAIQANLVNVGESNVPVCIVDTGVAKRHPDLPSDMDGENRISKVDGTKLKWRKDVRGHGTHIAGTISAVKKNNVGVVGVGQIPLFITRGLDDLGRSFESDIRESIDQCIAGGAKIIGISLGGSSMTTTFSSQVERLYSEGTLFFAAAGNDGKELPKFPAAHPKVVAVAAIIPNGSHWFASNTGDWVEIAAPGTDVISTSVNAQGDYVYSSYSGTSMATPHAAGAASLIWDAFPPCTNTQIRYAMDITAKDATGSTSSCNKQVGYGIVQIKSAMEWLQANPCRDASWGLSSHNGGCTVVQ